MEGLYTEAGFAFLEFFQMTPKQVQNLASDRDAPNDSGDAVPGPRGLCIECGMPGKLLYGLCAACNPVPGEPQETALFG